MACQAAWSRRKAWSKLEGRLNPVGERSRKDGAGEVGSPGLQITGTLERTEGLEEKRGSAPTVRRRGSVSEMKAELFLNELRDGSESEFGVEAGGVVRPGISSGAMNAS